MKKNTEALKRFEKNTCLHALVQFAAKTLILHCDTLTTIPVSDLPREEQSDNRQVEAEIKIKV